jgi:nucleotide-binding universal stress UspA family protein
VAYLVPKLPVLQCFIDEFQNEALSIAFHHFDRRKSMGYKTILVSLNEIGQLTNLLEFSAGVATEYDAHIIGLYVIPGPAIYPAVGPYTVPELIDVFTKYFDEQSRDVKTKFENVMNRNGLTFQWLEVRATAPEISQTVSEVGPIADLVVVSEIDRQASMGVEVDFIANVVMGVGRPVLILPRSAKNKLRIDQIVCGYNGSKEAARAIHDALPLLKRAADVRLVWVNPSKSYGAAGALPGADIAETLDRHGVKATVEAMPTSGLDVAEALLTRARDLDAGLIVMGAYGHSRLREYVLGGATRTALSTMTVPLLMSH